MDAETPKELEGREREPANRWKTEIDLAHKECREYNQRCNKVIERYRDEEKNSFKRNGKRFNILWSNIQTLQPALYSQCPKPQVDRRFKDRDPVGRLAAQTLERALSFLIQPENFDSQMRQARDDYLLTARGQAWIRYVPTFEKEKVVITPQNSIGIPKGAEILGEATGEQWYEQDRKAYESVEIDNINRLDFLHSPARVWEEVRWVAKRLYLRRDELKRDFLDENGGLLTEDEINAIPLNNSSRGSEEETQGSDYTENEAFQKAEVWEVWDKESKTVNWVCTDYDQLLKKEDDPLGLSGFFPCPKPLFGTMTSGTLVPIPDFLLYQDQAWELDELTTRINLLVKSIRVAGVYDKANDGIQRLATESAENELIPIDGWSRFAERGGLKGAVDFLPIEAAASVLQVLYKARESTKQEVYEITGISDIVRGTSHPRETASAQQTKAQFASTRLQERQTLMQMFARDIVAIVGEIVAEQFDEETLYNMAGISLLPESKNPEEFQALFSQAVQLLRDEATRSFRIDIETDSTIAINREAEKSARVEAVTGLGRFIRDSKQLSDMSPALMPFATELLMFATRSFKAGRNLESSLEDAMEAIRADLEQKKQQPPPVPPEVQKAQAEIQIMQQKAQAETQREQAKVALGQQELQMKQQESAAEIQLKREEVMAEIQLKREEAEAELALKREEAMAELELKREELIAELELATARQNHEIMNTPVPQQGVVNGGGRKIARFTTDEMGERVAIIEDA